MQTVVVGTQGKLTYRLNLEDFPANARAYVYFAKIEDLITVLVMQWIWTINYGVEQLIMGWSYTAPIFSKRFMSCSQVVAWNPGSKVVGDMDIDVMQHFLYPARVNEKKTKKNNI